MFETTWRICDVIVMYVQWYQVLSQLVGPPLIMTTMSIWYRNIHNKNKTELWPPHVYSVHPDTNDTASSKLIKFQYLFWSGEGCVVGKTVIGQIVQSPAPRLFGQTFVVTQIKQNITALRHWPLWGKSTADRWIALATTQRKMIPFDDAIIEKP